MKQRAFCLAVLIVALATTPALAQTTYSNGPVNGTTDAWTINFGFVVSDSFTVGFTQTVAGVQFAAWLFPGDVLETADVRIGSRPFGGTTYFDQVVNFTQSACSGNQYGFNVCIESSTFSGPLLTGGTYWLNLHNAVVNTGDPVYWDENSGPSSALDCCNGFGQVPPNATSVGTIPSESFTILGQGTTCCAPSSGTPEPGSFVLLCSGGGTLFGFIRMLRKLF